MAEETKTITPSEAEERIVKMVGEIKRLMKEIGIDYYLVSLGVASAGGVIAGVNSCGTPQQTETMLLACMEHTAGSVADDIVKQRPSGARKSGVVH